MRVMGTSTLTGGEGGREVKLQLRLLKRAVLVARAQTALYPAAGMFPLSLKSGADPLEYLRTGRGQSHFKFVLGTQHLYPLLALSLMDAYQPCRPLPPRSCSTITA